MDTRERVLEATARLLATSVSGDISTRAICEAAGIGAPVIYRQFGDKDGLLAAVVDHAFGRYLERKRSTVPTADPVQDLQAGWDNHIGFALEHPNIYRLMFSAPVTAAPEAVEESFRLLRTILERCAAAGRLRVSPQAAARMVMAGSVGVALSLITRPTQYPDDDVSIRVRDALFGSLLTGSVSAAGPGSKPLQRPEDELPAEQEQPSKSTTSTVIDGEGVSEAAATLAARLRAAPLSPPTGSLRFGPFPAPARSPSALNHASRHQGVPHGGALSPGESVLLQEWLERLADNQ